MIDQAEAWSEAAGRYEEEFVGPYHHPAGDALLSALAAIPEASSLTVADLGCGIGPLLPELSRHFAHVHAVDFAPAMLDRARRHCSSLTNVTFHLCPLDALAPLHGQLDVAVAVNSLVMPDPTRLEAVLSEAYRCLRPAGHFLGIVPAIDAVHYHTMLLLDLARRNGLSPEEARHDAAMCGEHSLYDFAFGGFHYLGIEQHFWQPFEVTMRLRQAGFRQVRQAKARLSWGQFARGGELRDFPPPWDWFFHSRR
jgi:SAM-dependent methyltransferase